MSGDQEPRDLRGTRPLFQKVAQGAIFKFGGLAGAIVLFFAIKFVISSTHSDHTQKVLETARWDEKFRSEFVTACTESARQEVAAEFSAAQLQNEHISKVIDQYSVHYCKCSSKAIEDNNVIASPYADVGRSIARSEEDDSLRKIEGFMSSPQGSRILEECRQRAIEIARK